MRQTSLLEAKHFHRILDANLNRSREGLRVCEEVARFYFDDARLTRELKNLRHDISQIFLRFPGSPFSLLAARDTQGDVGAVSSAREKNKKNIADLFLANIQRTKEALRVLEEVAHVLSPDISTKFKKLRFKAYAIEKQALPRLETLLHHKR